MHNKWMILPPLSSFESVLFLDAQITAHLWCLSLKGGRRDEEEGGGRRNEEERGTRKKEERGGRRRKEGRGE